VRTALSQLVGTPLSCAPISAVIKQAASGPSKNGKGMDSHQKTPVPINPIRAVQRRRVQAFLSTLLNIFACLCPRIARGLQDYPNRRHARRSLALRIDD